MEKKETKLAPMYYWSPLSMLDEMQRFMNERTFDLDRLLQPIIVGPGYRVPAIDIKDEGDKVTIHADMPGMSKEDVTIEVGEGVIDITAKKEQETEETSEGYIRKERGSMYFHRRLALPEGVDNEAIQAKLNDGVLEVVLPRLTKEEPVKKKVDVQ